MLNRKRQSLSKDEAAIRERALSEEWKALSAEDRSHWFANQRASEPVESDSIKERLRHVLIGLADEEFPLSVEN
eukprot:8227035-Prorocentrum_lima.AAC.1